MFTEVATEDLLRDVRGHDFDTDPVHEFGANRIDAITGLDRLIRAAQAEQLVQIAALHEERVAFMGISRGDPTLSVIGEVGMARNIGPTAAGTQVGLALGLDRLPGVTDLFSPVGSQNRWSGRWSRNRCPCTTTTSWSSTERSPTCCRV